MSYEPERRLRALDNELPAVNEPTGNVRGFDHDPTYAAGQFSPANDEVSDRGQAGKVLSPADADELANLAALTETGQRSCPTDFDIRKTGAIVNMSGFTDISVVSDAPDLCVSIVGGGRHHARCRQSMWSLVGVAPVE